MYKEIFDKLQTKLNKTNYKITPSDSHYFNNIECLKCGYVERVPFNVVGYKCGKCK